MASLLLRRSLTRADSIKLLKPWALRRTSSNFSESLLSSPKLTYNPPALCLNEPLIIAHQDVYPENGHSTSENLAMLHITLTSGDLSRAKRIMEKLRQAEPSSLKNFAFSLKVRHAYMEACLRQTPVASKEALRELANLQKAGLKPTVGTFAILINGFLRSNQTGTALIVLEEMVNKGFSVEKLLMDPYFEDVHVPKLIEINQNLSKNALPSLPISSTLSAQIKPEETGELETSTQPLAKDTPPEIDEGFDSWKRIVEPKLNEKLILPEVLSTNVVGVKLMKEVLESMSDDQLSRYERQRRIEMRSLEESVQRLKINNEKLKGISLNADANIKLMLWEWFQALSARIKQEQKKVLDSSLIRGRPQVVEVLPLLDADRISVAMINSMLRLSARLGGRFEMRLSMVLMKMGRLVELEYNATRKAERRNSQRDLKDLITQTANVDRQATAEAVKADEMWIPEWPASLKVRVGGALMSMFIDTAKVKVNGSDEMPAIYHSYQNTGKQYIGVVNFHPAVIEMLSQDRLTDTLDPRFLPMLVPPKPWIAFNHGGYLTRNNLCMRIKNCNEQYIYLQRADSQRQLDQVLQGLDVLSATPWRINSRLFPVVLEAWNSGRKFPSIPPLNPAPKYPDRPEDFQTNHAAKFSWLKMVKMIKNSYQNDHSLRCDVNYKVEIARAFLQEDFYFPHNLDFRGRAYPIPPLFNHLGNDLCRGLLIFAEGKPLGPHGLTWLKVQLANLSGYDKQSHEDRVAFVDENMEKIRRAATNPMDPEGDFWLKAEEPWQCLAACMELCSAVDSDDPESYVSHLPVHQDGTCNGLQHYAALGGDIEGARAVNLLVSDRPQDVYSGVANKVSELIEEDANNNVPEALLLRGKISRKIVKQTVMTNVYGVTFSGARVQIRNRLRELEELNGENHLSLATYIARKVFSSLGQMFTGARAIQEWLNESARRIAKSVPRKHIFNLENQIEERRNGVNAEATDEVGKKRRGRPPKVKQKDEFRPKQDTSVIWTTPLGLPIVQPYRRYKGRIIKTQMQMVCIVDPQLPTQINAQKQRTAFPPNYIHSLDATHMLMSALACNELGITFAAVHDSYWTHACTVGSMSSILREQFVRLHSNSLIENLKNEFEIRYKDYMMPREILEQAEAQRLEDETAEVARLFVTAQVPEDELDQDIDHEAEIDSDAAEDAEIDDGKEKKKAKSPKKKVKLSEKWVPLELPPLPPKGEFLVENVQKSPYFFH